MNNLKNMNKEEFIKKLEEFFMYEYVRSPAFFPYKVVSYQFINTINYLCIKNGRNQENFFIEGTKSEYWIHLKPNFKLRLKVIRSSNCFSLSFANKKADEIHNQLIMEYNSYD